MAQMNLKGAVLTDADLSNSNLSGALLAGADLIGADLTNSDLRGASLRGARLEWSNLSGSQLEAGSGDSAEQGISDSQLDADLVGVSYNQETQWPEGFEVPATAQKIY